MFSLEHILKYLDASTEQASDGSRRCMVWLEESLVNNNHLLCCVLKYEEKIGSSPAGCSADAMIIFLQCVCYAHIKHEGHQTNSYSHMTPTSA